MKAISDIVIVKKVDETPLSEVIHTEYGEDDKVWYGDVVEVGPGKRNKKTGRRIPVGVQVGDRVMVGSYTGERHSMFEMDCGEVVAVREPDIMAVVDDYKH